MSEALTPVRVRRLCFSVPLLGLLLTRFAGVATAAVPVSGSLGENSSNWAFVTDTGGWGARGDTQLYDSLNGAISRGSRIAGIALGYNTSTWAYWTQAGGWGARADSQLYDSLNAAVTRGSRIAGISLGYNSTTWAYWTDTGGWGARAETPLYDSLNSAVARGNRIAGIVLGYNSTTWAYWTQTGGWGARGESALLDSLNSAVAAGGRIAGIALGGNATTWAYWTEGGGWGARGDADMITALNQIRAGGSRINSIVLGAVSTNWIVFYGNGGWSGRGEQQMLDSMRSTVPPPPAAPTISGFFPTGGPPGTTVTVTGANFGTNNTAQVIFGGASLPRSVSTDGTSVTFTIPTTAQSGTITITTANGTAVTTAAFVVGNPSKIINLSIRTNAGTGAETLIAGFAVSGTGKTLLVRGVGPALTQFGVQGALNDPQLALFSGTTSIGSNDNWGSAANAAQITTTAAAAGAFALPTGGRDAAILSTVNAGVYTAQVSGVAGATGVSLIELYDANTGAASQLTNVSARAQVGTGNGILIAGFVIAGTGSKTVLIRGVGPTLSVFGVTGALADPQLTLFNGTTVVGSNDNWGSATNVTQLVSAAQQVGAFTLPTGSRDAALLVTLQPGTYTAQIAGVGNTTGVGLVEVYEVP